MNTSLKPKVDSPIISLKNRTQKSIELAWMMNYGAVLQDEKGEYTVIHVDKQGAVLINNGAVGLPVWDQVNKMKITGYKYIGELGGNNPIPEGQRVMAGKYKTPGAVTGKIFAIGTPNHGKYEVKMQLTIGEKVGYFLKSELEPVFD